MKRLRPVLLLLLVLVYLLWGMVPAWQAVREVQSGRDYATFHYAVIEAVGPGRGQRGDPYDTAALGTWSKAEGTRPTVHPYFYPPPFLLGMLWVTPPGRPPLSLEAGTALWFIGNQLLVLPLFWAFWRWFRARPLLLAVLLATFSPLPDTLKMGQANLPVLLLAVLGLWRGSGSLLGLASMAKMSPALYLVGALAQRRWRWIGGAVAAAVLSSLVALPLVPFDRQVAFYTQILPGFSTGNYHGLTVPITLPANHSIPDLFNQLWPGPDNHTLSGAARLASQALSLGLLGGLAVLARTRRDPLGQANLFGAFTALLLIAPVYTYEHHLVMMLLPLAALGQAWLLGRLPRWSLVLWLPAYGLMAWPLRWLREVQDWLPPADWLLQESKFFAVVVVALGCAWAVLRSPREEA